MKFKPRPRAARCLALLALCGLPAASHAALVVYTSAASFQAAVIGAATDDFDSLAPGPSPAACCSPRAVWGCSAS